MASAQAAWTSMSSLDRRSRCAATSLLRSSQVATAPREASPSAGVRHDWRGPTASDEPTPLPPAAPPLVCPTGRAASRSNSRRMLSCSTLISTKRCDWPRSCSATRSCHTAALSFNSSKRLPVTLSISRIVSRMASWLRAVLSCSSRTCCSSAPRPSRARRASSTPRRISSSSACSLGSSSSVFGADASTSNFALWRSVPKACNSHRRAARTSSARAMAYSSSLVEVSRML
mmetsp:Transcript_98048/g.282052  ORF Transcript_98048/g.282052 Transcript_98048/m.282052 type:complete len:231 (+) Transcript_98048:901-1593(+)